MIVVDTNIIVNFVLDGPQSKACYALHEADSEWFAPRLWREECANVFATYERKNLLPRAALISAFQDAENLIGLRECEIPIDRILTVAHRTGCSAYDAQYIALAEDLDLKLYTYDKKILKVVKELAIQPS